MPRLVTLLLLLCFIPPSLSSSVLIFVPGISMSNVLFSARVGTLLAGRGNSVTLFLPVYKQGVTYTPMDKNLKIIRLNVTDVEEYAKLERLDEDVLWREVGFMDPMKRKSTTQFAKILHDGCQGWLWERCEGECKNIGRYGFGFSRTHTLSID